MSDCFNCARDGHWAKDCPMPQRVHRCLVCRRVHRHAPGCEADWFSLSGRMPIMTTKEAAEAYNRETFKQQAIENRAVNVLNRFFPRPIADHEPSSPTAPPNAAPQTIGRATNENYLRPTTILVTPEQLGAAVEAATLDLLTTVVPDPGALLALAGSGVKASARKIAEHLTAVMEKRLAPHSISAFVPKLPKAVRDTYEDAAASTSPAVSPGPQVNEDRPTAVRRLRRAVTERSNEEWSMALDAGGGDVRLYKPAEKTTTTIDTAEQDIGFGLRLMGFGEWLIISGRPTQPIYVRLVYAGRERIDVNIGVKRVRIGGHSTVTIHSNGEVSRAKKPGAALRDIKLRIDLGRQLPEKLKVRLNTTTAELNSAEVAEQAIE